MSFTIFPLLFVRFGFTPSKIYRLALHAFDGVYDDKTIFKWEEVFIKRFSLSSSNVPACLTDQKSEQSRCLREATGECRQMLKVLYGSIICTIYVKQFVCLILPLVYNG